MSKKIFHFIPNTITCLNLFCGCMSIISSFNGALETAAYFIFAAAVFDFFDGFSARWLKAYSEMGKQLDSLADMVSFGVAPATIMYCLLLLNNCEDFIASAAYLMAVFSALRLAKFNIDTRQTDSFIGLPTPANALFICSLAFISSDHHLLSVLTGNLYFLWAVIVVFSYLMVSELPLFSLKFKSFNWKSNQIRYLFVIVSAIVLIIFHWAGLSLVILIYVILSIFTHILCSKKNTSL